jgi:hypothetical protein
MRVRRIALLLGIEGHLSHLKYNHRMLKNYLKGSAGDKIYTLLVASEYIKPAFVRMQDIWTKFNKCGFNQTIKIKIRFLINWMRVKRQEKLNLIFH